MRRTLYTSSFRNVVNVIAISVITVFLICRISYLLEGKTTYENYAAFVTNKEEYDVLLMGSSHVRYGLYPMDLWKEYGITSYNISGDSNTLAVSYWVLRQAFKYHIPKVLVMDIYDVSPNNIIYSWEFVHDATGIYPITIDKIRMVEDLSRNKDWTNHYGEQIGTRWDILFKLAEFHDRWQKLKAGDFWKYSDYVKKSTIKKGAKISTRVEVDDDRKHNSIQDARYDDLARSYLEKIIDLCRENNIKLVLINTGYNGNDEMELFANSIPEIAKYYNLEYIDFTGMDLMDYTRDFQTNGENTHVNVLGAEKLTRYLGKYLSENNMVIDHRGENGYEKWDMDYQQYRDYMMQELEDFEFLSEYIEMTKDNND